MAHQLQISLSTTCSSSSFRSPPSWPTQRWIAVSSEVFPRGFEKRREIGVRSGERKQCARVGVRVRSSLDTAGSVAVGQVTEVNKDTFWPLVKAAGDKTVVLDMYTQWYIYNLSFSILPLLVCVKKAFAGAWLAA
ncbi:thioredoxin F-type 1 [Actinidia rufa]|uniref:Thioredoxin F-type 1 n=1 Tax=Actinidia rufa TaxID=165716 RepID=A0A7J0GKF8_9ERIC|nr:thioredoxin F-type 1 [Actinidia rufa]